MTNTQNDTNKTELDAQKHLYNLFGQNFLDGDKPDDWRATTMNASEVKEFIDEFVVPYLAQREQAARIDELDRLIDFLDDRDVDDPNWHVGKVYDYEEQRQRVLQATKPEKGVS